MRILILSHMYPNNVNITSGIFIHNQIKNLIKKGCEVKVISPIPLSPRFLWFNNKWKQYGNVWTSNVHEDVSIIYPRYLRIPSKYFWGFSCFTMYSDIKKVVNDMVKQFAPDLIHAHNATPDGYVALKIGSNHRLPVVCSLRGSDINSSPYYSMGSMALTMRVIAEADQIVTVSNDLKQKAEKLAKPKREIQTVYNGCDSDIFKYNKQIRHEYRQMLKISDRDTVIIFVGDLSISKGILELLTVFIRLKDKYLDLHLLFLGEGNMHAEILNKITNESIDNRVHLVGRQESQKVANWLCMADIFALPTYSEGLPNAMLEAMACGLPVVVTTVGGIPEVVENGHNGILIKEKDVDALHKSLEYLVLNKDRRDQIGHNARLRVLDLFTWDRNGNEMINIYIKILAGEPGHVSACGS